MNSRTIALCLLVLIFDLFLYSGGVLADDSGSSTANQAIIKGYVLERGTKKPIEFATISVVGVESAFAESDQSGAFELVLPSGEHKLHISAMGYMAIDVDEKVSSGEVVEVVYYLEPEVYDIGEIVVRGRRKRKEISRHVVTATELKSMPGSMGDAVKAIENLPGVGNMPNSGGIVLRGSNRDDSNIYIDGHIIPILFHFGGFKSVYNADLLSDIEVLTGSFGVEFAGATGGIVNLRTRASRNDRWGGYLDTSLLDITALAEGPLGAGRSLALSARYSLIQYIIQGILSIAPDDVQNELSFSAYPSYWDYVARYDHRLNGKYKFSAYVFGAKDKMEVYLGSAADSEPAVVGNMGFETEFHKLILTLDSKSAGTKNRISAAITWIDSNFFLGRDLFVGSSTASLHLYQHYLKRVGINTFRLGWSVGAAHTGISANIIRPPKEGDVYVSFSNREHIVDDQLGTAESLFFFLEDTIKLGPVELIPGINLRYLFLARRMFYSDPRLAMRWKLVKGVVFKSAVGLYSQAPKPDEIWPPWGNPNLDPEHALQTAAGVEWKITESIDLDAEVYYKHVFNKVVPDDETLYSNAGEARIYGFEFLIRHRLTKRFFGWLAYSYCKSERKDTQGSEWRPFDEDVPHTLTLVLSWKPFQTWQFGTRFQLASGRPYTPIIGSIYNADNDTYIPIYDPNARNSERITTLWYQWDLRVDKMFVFDSWILSVYLDVQNVTLADRPLGMAYSYDYSSKQPITMFPIIPSLGIRARF